MSFFSKLTVAALVASGVTAGGSRAVADQPSTLLYPQGGRFCFTFYSTKTNDLSSVLTSGATTTNDSAYVLTNGATALGPFYGSQTAPLAEAVGFGTKYIYKVAPPSMSNANAAVFDAPGYVWPSDQTITNEVAVIVSAVRTNASIAIWDFDAEELRPWKPMELHYFKIVYAAIHASDPTNRPVYNYQPNNRNAATLSTIAPYEDICTKGMYVNTITDDLGHSCMTNRIWARWTMEQELGAIAASNTLAVPWIHLWMAADPPAGYVAKINEWCRHDAYMGLIMGGKGIVIFSGFQGRSGFANTNFYAYLNGYLSVARDLNGPLNLAPVFLFGQKRTNVSMTISSGPTSLQLAYDGIVTNYPSIAWLAVAYAGTDYLFMVNSAEQSVTATFGGAPVQDRTDLFAGVTNATPGGSFPVTLPAHGVKAFRFAAVPPPVITQAVMTNGAFMLGGMKAAGWNYVLQTAPNLTPPATWTSIATNAVGGNFFNFTDLQAAIFPQRFYRVLVQ